MRGSAPTVHFLTGPVPPELTSSPPTLSRRTRPAVKKCLPLQERHSLTLSVMREDRHTLRKNLGGSLTGPFRHLGWCLYLKLRQTPRGETMGVGPVPPSCGTETALRTPTLASCPLPLAAGRPCSPGNQAQPPHRRVGHHERY